MPRKRRKKAEGVSPSVLILIIIASVLLSTMIFYGTGLIVGGGI